MNGGKIVKGIILTTRVTSNKNNDSVYFKLFILLKWVILSMKIKNICWKTNALKKYNTIFKMRNNNDLTYLYKVVNAIIHIPELLKMISFHVPRKTKSMHYLAYHCDNYNTVQQLFTLV